MLETAAELAELGVDAGAAGRLRDLAADGAGLPVAAAAAASLAEDPEAALGALAVVLLSVEVG